MIKNTYQLVSLLGNYLKTRLYLVLLLNFTASITEIFGVASIFPFMSVVANPQFIEENKYLSALNEYFDFNNATHLLIVLGLGTLFLTSLSITARAITSYFNTWLVQTCSARLSHEIMLTSLKKRYEWHLNNKAGDVTKVILSEVDQMAMRGLMPLIQLFNGLFVCCSMMLIFVFIDPKSAITMFAVMALFYGASYMIVKKVAASAGRDRVISNAKKFKFAQEAFFGIKYTKIYGLEKSLADHYKSASQVVANSVTSVTLIKQLPRSALELIAISMALVWMIVIISKDGHDQVPLAVISVYALAGYRMLPAIQNVFASIATLKYAQNAIESIYERYGPHLWREAIELSYTPSKGEFAGDIKLAGVSFSYKKHTILKNISLSIPFGQKIAIVGASGSGKTTLLDVICGLLTPTRGKIMVGNTVINNHTKKGWQGVIGYTPQEVFLSTGGLQENITLSHELATADAKRLRDVMKTSELTYLKKYITNENQNFSKNDQTLNLSGGQKQRVGIARALFRQDGYIVFDEATSALDAPTEQNIYEKIFEKYRLCTFIVVSHRLSSLRTFDRIIVVDKGKIVADGSHDELVVNSSAYKSLLRDRKTDDKK